MHYTLKCDGQHIGTVQGHVLGWPCEVQKVETENVLEILRKIGVVLKSNLGDNKIRRVWFQL